MLLIKKQTQNSSLFSTITCSVFEFPCIIKTVRKEKSFQAILDKMLEVFFQFLA